MITGSTEERLWMRAQPTGVGWMVFNRNKQDSVGKRGANSC
jgi:hypothetical protein